MDRWTVWAHRNNKRKRLSYLAAPVGNRPSQTAVIIEDAVEAPDSPTAIQMALHKWREWDVWICVLNMRVYHMATPALKDNDVLKPPSATGHLDTIFAKSRQHAIRLALQKNRS